MSVSETEASSAKPNKKLWLRQFSIRSLLILMLVSGLGVGWLGNVVRKTREQSEVVQRFREAGIRVRHRRSMRASLIPDRQWTRDYLGEFFFKEASGLTASEYVSAELLKDIERLPTISMAYLNNTQVTDETVKILSKSSWLSKLYVGASDVTDHGLEHLRNHPQLDALVLFDTQITDAGMEAICTVPGLESLSIQQTSITDSAVRVLAQSKLKDFLTDLDVSETNVTPASLTEIKKLRILSTLHFRNIAASLEELKTLAEMRWLRRLDITGSGLSRDEVEQLRTELGDNCLVHCGDAK